mgnify:CR=1 FL=1
MGLSSKVSSVLVPKSAATALALVLGLIMMHLNPGLFRQGWFHAKLMLLDEDRVFVGSSNLDPRSLYLNTEMGLAAESAADLLEVPSGDVWLATNRGVTHVPASVRFRERTLPPVALVEALVDALRPEVAIVRMVDPQLAEPHLVAERLRQQRLDPRPVAPQIVSSSSSKKCSGRRIGGCPQNSRR